MGGSEHPYAVPIPLECGEDTFAQPVTSIGTSLHTLSAPHQEGH